MKWETIWSGFDLVVETKYSLLNGLQRIIRILKHCIDVTCYSVSVWIVPLAANTRENSKKNKINCCNRMVSGQLIAVKLFITDCWRQGGGVGLYLLDMCMLWVPRKKTFLILDLLTLSLTLRACMYFVSKVAKKQKQKPQSIITRVIKVLIALIKI